jgi:hypothetical protein
MAYSEADLELAVALATGQARVEHLAASIAELKDCGHRMERENKK